MALLLTQKDASEAMLHGLTERIRDELRKRIMERIEPDIEAAIDAALETFKATIESYHEVANMRDTVKVLIERKPLPSTDGATRG